MLLDARRISSIVSLALALPLAGTTGCSETPGDHCRATGDAAPESLEHVGCMDDFERLASEPLDSTLPGARSVKMVQDHADADALYFQNSVEYQIHYDFVSTHLSGDDLPIVPQLADFNTTEYFTPDRRFNLGAVTRYDGPQVWALEIAPYDTASADMIARNRRAFST